MNTALVTTTHLLPEERLEKTIRFAQYYRGILHVPWDLIILDNASPPPARDRLRAQLPPRSTLVGFETFHGRPTINDYLYLWRAVFYLGEILREYEKVVYMDNDFYVLSQRMLTYIEGLREGWTSFWDPEHHWPESGCHVLVRGCAAYEAYTASGDYTQYNNQNAMELMLPFTHVDHTLRGERYGERNAGHLPDPSMDFYAQGQLAVNFTTIPQLPWR